MKRDTEIKRGQLAHLDGDPTNNELDNLAFLCLEHHDEYDGKTSQSKGLSQKEVKAYRSELYNHFADWSQTATSRHLLNFLASRISNKDIAEAVVEVASRVYFYGPRHAHDVLTMPEMVTSEVDTFLNHMYVLDSCAAWGLLSYEQEETKDEEGLQYLKLAVNHLPICKDLADIIEGWIKERGEVNWG